MVRLARAELFNPSEVAILQVIGRVTRREKTKEKTKGRKTKGHSEQLTGSEDLVSLVGC